jgi:hypothetical protein
MIPKSGYRFSEKDHAPPISYSGMLFDEKTSRCSFVNSATALSGTDGVSDLDLRDRFQHCRGRDPIGAGQPGRDSEGREFIVKLDGTTLGRLRRRSFCEQETITRR